MSNSRKETQKLYRYIQHLAHRLDVQLQNVSEWRELFDIETVLTRQKLKDACENFLVHGYCDFSLKVEDILWRKGFYDLIQKLRQDKQMLQTNSSFQALYNAHLNAAHCFYHHLLIHIREKYCSSIKTPVDWFTMNQSRLGSGRNSTLDSMKKENFEWGMVSCQRCLLYLGDLARYRIDINDDKAAKIAERFYYQAVFFNPDNGMPHNQLGILKQQIGHNDCEVAYHYLRCLLAVNSFEGAEANFRRTLERNHTSMKDAVNRGEATREELLETFLFEFLDLQRRLLRNRVSSDEAYACYMPVVDKFVELLNIFMPEKATEANDLKNSKTTRQTVQSSTETVLRINSSMMIKIFTICILITSKLNQNGSNTVEISICFTLTMLLELLQYVIRIMCESPIAKLLSGLQIIVESKTSRKLQREEKDSDEYPYNESNEDGYDMKRERARQIRENRRRRRRRRQLWSEDSSDVDDVIDNHKNSSNNSSTNDSGSDLSEGELLPEHSDESYSSAESNSEFEGFENPFLKDKREQTRNSIKLNEAGCLLSLQCQEQMQTRKFQRVFNATVDHSAARDSPLKSKLEAALSYINEYCYLSTLKILSDWMYQANDILGKYTEDIYVIYQRYAEIIQKMPFSSILSTVLQCRKKKTDILFAENLKDTSSRQNKALPEDTALVGMPIFYPFHKNLDFFWADSSNDSVLLQCLIRIHSLNAFIVSVSKKVRPVPEVVNDKVSENAVLNHPASNLMPENASTGKVSENEELQESLQTGNDLETSNQVERKDQKGLMKAMAKQKLAHDVMELQEKMSSSDLKEIPEMPSYLILDCQALCRHLSLIRSLVKSREFLFIVPIQVVQALDELKRYNPSAREAIKFLEEELRQKSRWLRSQKDQEFLDLDIKQDSKKKKKLAIEDWRFYQVVKCACYFSNLHNMKNMVSILTYQISGESSGSLGTRATLEAIELSKNMGIKIDTVVDFYQKWIETKKTCR